MDMLVSVITVCYNSEKTIRQTLESVLAQTYPHIEYIIVDGKSTDGTMGIVSGYAERFAQKGYRFRVVSEKDNGIYDAMKKGIRMATGELVGIINSDDWYEPIAVETAVHSYGEEKYDLFYADINLIRADGVVIRKRSRLDRFPSSRHWNHPTTFITRRTYEEQGGYLCQTVYDKARIVGVRVSLKHP